LLVGKSQSPVKSAPGWNEKLASDSEAIVKAEREPDVSTEQMQQQTVQYLQTPSPEQQEGNNK
jgi:hypothetical protein